MMSNKKAACVTQAAFSLRKDPMVHGTDKLRPRKSIKVINTKIFGKYFLNNLVIR